MTRQVLVYPGKDELMTQVAERFIRTVGRTLDAKSQMHVVLTGGSVGIGILAAVSASKNRDSVDWHRLHFWWGDERWLKRGAMERNDQQAWAALLAHLELPDEHVHRFPASDGQFELGSAADSYAADLDRLAPAHAALPHFDLVFLGVGPDGHIASLFPDRPELIDDTRLVVAVRNSPKLPPERLSLTLRAINSAESVWLALAGADKASALGLALAGASPYQVPVAGAHGRRRTVFFVDEAAAAEVPNDLITTEY